MAEHDIMPDAEVLENDVNGVSRRQFLLGAATVGALLGAGSFGLFSMGSKAQASTITPGETPTWPWPYKQLDPEAVALRAYKGYSEGGCCYGAAKGLIDELQVQVGYPYQMFPTDMFRFGGGGVAGWGTLCGALLGASAVINLVTEKANVTKVVNELLGWYTQAAFPMYVPAGKAALPTSVSGSPLCHASVTLWCKSAKFTATSPERAERCARLTADVAKHAALLLNQQAQGKLVLGYQPPKSVTECMSCHGKAGMDNTNGSQNCVQCHEPHK